MLEIIGFSGVMVCSLCLVAFSQNKKSKLWTYLIGTISSLVFIISVYVVFCWIALYLEGYVTSTKDDIIHVKCIDVCDNENLELALSALPRYKMLNKNTIQIEKIKKINIKYEMNILGDVKYPQYEINTYEFKKSDIEKINFSILDSSQVLEFGKLIDIRVTGINERVTRDYEIRISDDTLNLTCINLFCDKYSVVFAINKFIENYDIKTEKLECDGMLYSDIKYLQVETTIAFRQYDKYGYLKYYDRVDIYEFNLDDILSTDLNYKNVDKIMTQGNKIDTYTIERVKTSKRLKLYNTQSKIITAASTLVLLLCLFMIFIFILTLIDWLTKI